MKLTKKQLEALELFVERSEVNRLRRNLNFIIFSLASLGDNSPIPIDRAVFEDYAELSNLLEKICG